MKFGERIRERALALGLSDSEVSRRIGVDETRVGRYVRGVNEPNLATLVRLCDVLSLTPNDLLLPEDVEPRGDKERRRMIFVEIFKNEKVHRLPEIFNRRSPEWVRLHPRIDHYPRAI